MLVSIITATYNSEKTIAKTLESIKQQTYKNIEHIVIDGCSKDKTISIVQQFNISKIIVVQKDKGIYYALNKGLKIANGDIIFFLHSDDYFSSEYVVQYAIDKFNSSESDIVYFDIEYVNKSGKTIRYWKTGTFKTQSLKWGWMPPHTGIFFKKNLIEKVGFFNTEYKISADYDWIIRALHKTQKISYIPMVSTKMTIGGESNKSLKNIIKKLKEDYKIAVKNRIGGLYTIFFKNFRKISQFYIKKKLQK